VGSQKKKTIKNRHLNLVLELLSFQNVSPTKTSCSTNKHLLHRENLIEKQEQIILPGDTMSIETRTFVIHFPIFFHDYYDHAIHNHGMYHHQIALME